MSRLISRQSSEEMVGILDWYADKVYGRVEGPRVVPFYCDPVKVGLAAVDPGAIARADEGALFKLFIGLTMYQARRDVVIQGQQRSWNRTEAASLLSLSSLRRRLIACPCPHLAPTAQFELTCTVAKTGKVISCDQPILACPVRLAASTWDRMADLGKLPTSAFMRIWAIGGTAKILKRAMSEPDPTLRVEFVVNEFSQICCVGRKLATLFVSVLSTPALAPGMTPWWPILNGNLAVVLDTHVIRAVNHLSRGSAGGSYQSRVNWIRRVAESIDLKRLHVDLPTFSPRIVQQALYAFCSKSNRLAWGLPCPRDESGECQSKLCPFCGAGAAVVGAKKDAE